MDFVHNVVCICCRRLLELHTGLQLRGSRSDLNSCQQWRQYLSLYWPL